MKKIIITSFILLFTLSSNAQWWGKDRVKGDGNVITEKRKTSAYDGVGVGGSFDVVLVKGKEGNLTIEGEKNLLPYIITEVKNGMLKIKVKKGVNIRMTRKLVVTVPVREIEKVSLGGSGNIKGKVLLKSENLDLAIGGSGNIDVEVDAENLKTSIAGSGDVFISGKTDYMKCSIAGSGSVKAYELEAKSVKASIAGSGSVRATVTDEIKASIAGSGSVYYKGDPPKVKSTSAGSGSVIKKG